MHHDRDMLLERSGNRMVLVVRLPGTCGRYLRYQGCHAVHVRWRPARWDGGIKSSVMKIGWERRGPVSLTNVVHGSRQCCCQHVRPCVEAAKEDARMHLHF
jgi:hypothetical protein